MDENGSLEVRWVQGFTTKTVEFVDNKTVCYSCGSHLCFLNLETKMQSVLPSPGRGVGAFTANGNSGIFAFSEQKLSPSIFVYVFPELELKNELKGTAQLDYTSLTLSDSGPYLACCSAAPDHTIAVWNWENAEPLCKQPQAGHDVTSLVFNPLNWLQLCALGSASLTIWNIEKSASLHVLKASVIELPANDGSFSESLAPTSYTVSDQLPYHGPEMPPSAIAGLTGDKAECIVNKLCSKATLTPAAICWTTTAKLYVGCAEGFLLLIDPENQSVSVLFDPTTADSIPELRDSTFQTLALNKNGLIAVGKKTTMHCLQIKGSHIDITQTWQLDGPVTAVMYSPDCETLLLYSNTGQIYMLDPSQSKQIVKVLDVLSGNFVAAALLHTNNPICVSLRDSGHLQLWSTDGIHLGSLSLQTEVTTLACCPIAHYAAVGTTSGRVLFVDLNSQQQPRLVHQVQLYHCPVDHLVFDQEGHYLLASASDSHVYMLEAKPSKCFSVIGYTVVPGPVLSLSTQCIRDCKQVKVLALSSQKGQHRCGSLLTLLSLPVTDIAGPDCVDRHGRLSPCILQVSTYKVPNPLESCVLGASEIFAYCHKRKGLQRFQLPQDTGSASSQELAELKPEQELRGHPLGPACLLLSPDQQLLASVGRDGLLRIRETASMERYVELQCHSCRDGGVRSLSFSADSQTLVTTGFKDGSLVVSNFRIKGVNTGTAIKAAPWSQSAGLFLRNTFNAENPVLIDWPEWDQGSPASTDKPEESKVSAGAETEAVSDTLPPTHPTWLESRRAAVLKEDNEKYSEKKKNMKKTLKEFHDTIQEMMRENENLPDIERLEHQEFNLNVEEQKKLEAMVEQEVTRVRKEIEMKNLEKCYLRDILKRDCWDSLEVKGKAIKAFHSEREVKNYPLRERTDKEVEELCRVQDMRKLEMTVCTWERSLKEKSNRASEKEPGSAAITGSYSAQLGCSSPYVYDQFSLHTTEQKINHIILLQDVIYRIKTAFNADFEALRQQKLQEIKHVKERNNLIAEISEQLDMKEKQWEPSLSYSEQPERLFTVDDSEIKAEKYLNPNERKEEKKQSKEGKHSAVQGDNFRDRALDDMMDEILVKKEGIFKLEIPPPEFVATKPKVDWSEEEINIYKEFEKKVKDLHVKKMSVFKSQDSKMRKLQNDNTDAAKRFDEALMKLFEKKLKCEMAIYQEELKITYLAYSIQLVEEMRNQELELKLTLEKVMARKDEIGEEVKRHEEDVDLFLQTYNSLVAEDKDLDKEFKKEFSCLPGNLVEYLYRLFKRRPRVQKMRTQTDDSSTPFMEQRARGSLAPNPLDKMLKAMEELDSPENMPDVLNPSQWERFCFVRRAKVESEHKVKVNALTLAEMQAFLQKRRDEDKAAQEEIKNLSDELESLHKEKNRFLMNIMVQVLLKQGQVELSATDLTVDYTDSVLHHRGVVEDLNGTIRTLAEEKIASMVKCKGFWKGIRHMLWEHKRLEMHIEDLRNKARDIQTLQITEEHQDYLNEIDRDNLVFKQVASLEKNIDFQEKSHQQNVQHCLRRIEELKRQAARNAEKIVNMEQQLPDIQVSVAERRHIYESIAVEDAEAEERHARYREILQKKNLEDRARSQAEDLAMLWAEVERLRMRNFPLFQPLKHN